ncbi:DUF397 domain-containing protein [Actinophytocola sediminis]
MRTLQASPGGQVGAGWRRSSASVPDDECVEIWRRGDGVRVRDSKDRKGTELRFRQETWELLLRGLHH